MFRPVWSLGLAAIGEAEPRGGGVVSVEGRGLCGGLSRASCCFLWFLLLGVRSALTDDHHFILSFCLSFVLSFSFFLLMIPSFFNWFYSSLLCQFTMESVGSQDVCVRGRSYS